MSVAFGLPTMIVTDRFVGNEDVGLTLPRPKSIKFDNVVVAFTGSLSAPPLVAGINNKYPFEDAVSAGELIVSHLDTDTDYNLLIADGHSLYELDNQKGFYEMSYSAIGAGYQYCLGSYYVLKDPLMAVYAACHYSPLCSTPIDMWLWDETWVHKVLESPYYYSV